MIPLIDLKIRKYIEDGLAYLRTDTSRISTFFSYASPKTIQDITKLITDYKLHVLSGYPRTETQLPAIIIQIAGEEETSYGIGDGIDELYPESQRGEDNYLKWNLEDHTKYVQENMQMRASIRIEAWSDNTVITSFLYAIIKYCLLSNRLRMHKEGFILPSISGTDLEPAPEYFDQIFIFRRAAILNFEYISSYHVGEMIIGEEPDQMPIGSTIDDIDVHTKGVLTGGKENNK